MLRTGLACLLLSPLLAYEHRIRPERLPLARLRASAVVRARVALSDSAWDDDDDDDRVLERESVREAAVLDAEQSRTTKRSQVFGAWLDNDIVQQDGVTVDGKLSLGVAAMSSGSYPFAVATLREAVAEAGGEMSRKGGQTAIWLAQALYANGEHAAAAATLERLQTTHPMRNVRKAAHEIKYVLTAPELTLDASNFVQIPEKILEAERRGRQTPEYAKMEKPPEKYSLEWYMLQKPVRARAERKAADPTPAVAALAAGLALCCAAVATFGPSA